MIVAMFFGAWVSQMIFATHALPDCVKDMEHKACVINKKIAEVAVKMCELQDPHPDCATKK